MTISIGSVGYAAAAAAFLFLFVLLLTSWRGRLQGILLATACLCTALWAAVEAIFAVWSSWPYWTVALLRVARSAIWLVFLLVLLGYAKDDTRNLRRALIAVVALAVIAMAVPLFMAEPLSGTQNLPDTIFQLLFALIGLVLLEQLYRNVRPEQRWAIKFLCLGLGAMFACDFFLYSETLLFRRVDVDVWAARGAVNCLVVPFIAVAAARNPRWSLDIFVSRGILFHSAAMLGAALYLLGMAGAGYYIRYFGGSWGSILQITFLFGAFLLLLVILFSGTVRARLKVFLSKNFFNYRFDYREEWLRFTQTLSAGESGLRLRERSIEAIAELVDSPGGALWLKVDGLSFQPVAHWNMPGAKGELALDSPLCAFLGKRQWVVDLDGWEAHPELYEGLQIPDWMRALPQVWLVVPLIHHEQLLGMVVLTRSKGGVKLDWEVNDLLKTAGRQAASYLAQLETAKELLIARQFESFNRMSAFVVHDLKNLVAQLSLLLSNAPKHKDNPAFQQDMLETVANSVDKVKRLLSQLRGGHTLDPATPVVLQTALRGAIAAKAGMEPVPRLEAGGESVVVLAHEARLERILGHLIQNAIEATPRNGSVTVDLTQADGMAIITISDTGCGMSENFMRYRLFNPFESTKSAGMGIGTYEVRQYVRELGGRVEVSSREGEGTHFRVELPSIPHEAAVAEKVKEGRL